MEEDNSRHIVRVYVGALSNEYEALSVEASKHTTAEEIVTCIVQKLEFQNALDYELAEVIGNSTGQECKERRITPSESPVALKLLWPKTSDAADSILFSSPALNKSMSTSLSGNASMTYGNTSDQYRFCLREKMKDTIWSENFAMDPQIIRDYFYRFLYQPNDKEYPDLCQLPDLNEQTLLDNLKSRFNAGHIYTYVGSILISVNPFKFHPIYNPKYVKLYQNRRLEELPPHIFAIADSAYHKMLKERNNQCIVISGESGSGKTESGSFLLHHLTALSQKGSHGSGVEQTILSAGPVLEAFGNAKTAHNNNSSRFGKFIQVSYLENGMVHGATVQKYLLEKSRICCQAKNERNYHVFYYLLAGASELERKNLKLLPPTQYHYLKQSGCLTLEGVDESYEFSRLKQSMEMVGFGSDKQKKLFCVLSSVLLLGNVEFLPKKSSYHHDESVSIKNPETVRQISSLLRVTEETLTAALTCKRARASGEMLVINYRMPEAVAARDAMAKCLYGTLFDWIVLQVNHSLLSKKTAHGSEHLGKSIGVLDIFGFEDFSNCNSFEQFCINYANEHLQHYFNLHVFKYEQEEYEKEGIRWSNIDFMDNTPCLQLIESRPSGLICILDDQCSFPGATNETLLQKFNSVHKDHEFYLVPQKWEAAFIIRHYAGTVKYQVSEFREKNMDLMRHDIISVLKNSSLAFVRELVGNDPVAVFRWAILRAFFRAYFAFIDAGNRQRATRLRCTLNRAYSSPGGRRRSSMNEHLVNVVEGIQQEGEHSSESYASLAFLESDYKSGVNVFLDPNELGKSYDGDMNLTSFAELSGIPVCEMKRASSPMIALSNAHYRGLESSPGLRGTGFGCDCEMGHLSKSQLQLCSNDEECLRHDEDNETEYILAWSSFTSSHYCQHTCSSQTISKCSAASLEGIDSSALLPVDGNDYFCRNSKNRSFRSQPLITRSMKNLQSVKTLASQTAALGVTTKYNNPRKQPFSVSQQFQQSLNSLMVTLNQANPFFIRCIKSNSEKIPAKFDDELVQRQLRYTGMLETVRIRQAGYNVRLTFEEFVQLYRILLPNGLNSSKYDVKRFLQSLNLNSTNYQLGKTKVFLRETEKIKLDYILHQQIISSIISIQRWYRSVLERRHFIRVQQAIVSIQSYFRMVLAQKRYSNLKMRNLAATYIQKVWKGYQTRKWYTDLKSSCIQFQARVRGNLARIRYHSILEQQRKLSKQRDKLQVALSRKEGESTDEAFLSKGSSQEELESHRVHLSTEEESEESSGIQDYSETELDEAVDKPPVVVSVKRQANVHADGRDRFEAGLQKPALTRTNVVEDVYYIERQKRKVSLKSRKEKGVGKFVDEDLASDIQDYNDDSMASMNDKYDEVTLDSDSETEDTLTSTKEESKEITQSELKHCVMSSVISQSTSAKRQERLYTSSYSGSSDVFDSKASLDSNMKSFGESGDSYIRSRVDKAQAISAADVSKEKRKSREFWRRRKSIDTSDESNERMARLGHASETNLRLDHFNESSHEDTKSSGRGSKGLSMAFTSRRSHHSAFNESSSEVSVFPMPHKAFGSKPFDRSKDHLLEEVSGNKAGRTSSTPDFGTEKEVRRTRSVSETRKTPLTREYGSELADLQQCSTEVSLMGSNDDVYLTSGNNHYLEKSTKFRKGDFCKACRKNMHALFAPGSQCQYCNSFFHAKCEQNGMIKNTPCYRGNHSIDVPEHCKEDLPRSKSSSSAMNVGGRRKNRKQMKTPVEMRKPGKFSLTGTSEFTDRTDQIISGVDELLQMQEFIGRKIYQVRNKEKEKENTVDKVFQQALKEFKTSLVTTFSVENKQSTTRLSIRYKDLIASFAKIMETVCKEENIGEEFPITMGVNAFRGFLNEFMNSQRVEEKSKVSKSRKERRKDKAHKRQKIEETLNFRGHSFVTMVINIPTACEICSSFIMWPIERGVVCQKCKLACHKKCHVRIQNECAESQIKNGTSGNGSSGVFGAPLATLTPEDGGIPSVVSTLITLIELYGLCTEGLYRKSGVSSKVRELKQHIEERKDFGIDYFSIHVFTSVLKCFFRELPEPLLTYELYDEFLRAAELSHHEDRVHTIFNLLKKLPKPNYQLMERLVFHLVRVVSYEAKNKMNANSLSIVFAPCILRTNKAKQVQESLFDIGRQTKCIETIIEEQLKKYTETLQNIESLDSTAHSFTVRLNSIRCSKMRSHGKYGYAGSIGSVSEGSGENKSTHDSTTPESMSAEEEEELLTRQLRELQDEKAMLTQVLPSLSRTPSDEDMLSTDPEMDSPAGSVDDLPHAVPSPSPRQARAQSLQYSKSSSILETFHNKLPPPGNSPSPLPRISKNRGPHRKPPSRFLRHVGSIDFGEDDQQGVSRNAGDDNSVDQSNDDEAIMV